VSSNNGELKFQVDGGPDPFSATQLRMEHGLSAFCFADFLGKYMSEIIGDNE